MTKAYFLNEGTSGFIGIRYIDRETKTGAYEAIAPSLTSVPSNLFNGDTDLVSVGDLSACTSIGQSAFSGCTALTSVGDLLACTSIGSYAFNGCTSITEIVLPNVAHPIYTGTFSGCTSLKYVDVPNATEFERAFYGSTAVEFVRVGIVTLTHGFNANLYEGGTMNRCIFLPKCASVTANEVFSYSPNILYCGFGLVTDMTANAFQGAWIGSGSNILAIIVKNTMASIQAVTNFPFGATYRSHLGQLHFACSDGKITYDGTTWTATPWASVAELPTVCTDDYTFAVGGTNYRWNMATKEYEVVA